MRNQAEAEGRLFTEFLFVAYSVFNVLQALDAAGEAAAAVGEGVGEELGVLHARSPMLFVRGLRKGSATRLHLVYRQEVKHL